MKNIAMTAIFAGVLATTGANASATLSAAEGDTWAAFGAQSAKATLPTLTELTSEYVALIGMRVANDFMTTADQNLNAADADFYEAGGTNDAFQPAAAGTFPADADAFAALWASDPELALNSVYRLRFRRLIKGVSATVLSDEGGAVASADHVVSITANRTALTAARKDANGEIAAAEDATHTTAITEADAGPRLEQFIRVRSFF